MLLVESAGSHVYTSFDILHYFNGQRPTSGQLFYKASLSALYLLLFQFEKKEVFCTHSSGWHLNLTFTLVKVHWDPCASINLCPSKHQWNKCPVYAIHQYLIIASVLETQTLRDTLKTKQSSTFSEPRGRWDCPTLVKDFLHIRLAWSIIIS